MSAVLNKMIDIGAIANGGSFDLGWRGSGAAYFANATPYVLTLFMPSLPNGQTLLPGQNWGFVIDSQDAFISIQKTLFTTVPLATVLYWTVFNDPHDLDSIPNGVYSSYIANVIGGTLVTNAQTLTNDGNGAQNVIEMTLANNVSGNSNVIIKNDGTLILFGQTKPGLQTLLEVAPGNPSSLAINADNFAVDPVFGTTTITNTNTLVKIFQLLASGQIITPFPPQLLTGNQETGVCGIQVSNIDVAAGNVFGQGVNFKTHMTNIPSSITLTPITQNNITSVTATNITRDGFFFKLTANLGNTTTDWFGTYTTVGN